MITRRWRRTFALTFVLFYFSLLFTPFVGLALADYTPPEHHIPDNIYQIPDHKINEDIYIVPEDPHTIPDEPYKAPANEQNDQEHNASQRNPLVIEIDESELGWNPLKVDHWVDLGDWEYKLSKFVAKDVITGHIDWVGNLRFNREFQNVVGSDSTLYRNIFKGSYSKDVLYKGAINGLGYFMPADQNPIIAPILDGGSAFFNIEDVRGHYTNWKNWRNTVGQMTSGANIGHLNNLGFQANWYKNTGGIIAGSRVMGKLNVATGVISAGFSAYDAYSAFKNEGIASTSGWASTGEVLMGLAPAATAIGGPAAGLIVGGLGLAIWGGAKIVQNWDRIKNAGKSAVAVTKRAVKAAGDGVKKLGSKIKGWFKR